jgi:hypothetical protein
MEDDVKLHPQEAKLILEMLRKRLADYVAEIERTKQLIFRMERQMMKPATPKPVVVEEPLPEPPEDWVDEVPPGLYNNL